MPEATVLFGRDIRRTLPQLTFRSTQPNIKPRDDKSKLKMKEHADKKHRVKESQLTVGDPVLVKVNNKSKADAPFEPKPLVVTD